MAACFLKVTFLCLWMSLSLHAAVEANIAQLLLGCYQEDLANRNLWHKPQYDKQQLTPFSCVGACAKQNYTFAAVQNGTLCFCGSQHVQASATMCTVRCTGDRSYSCGGVNGSHIYNCSTVPIISSTTAYKVLHVKTNQITMIEFSAWTQTPSDEMSYLSNITYQNQTASDVRFEWSLDGNAHNSNTSIWQGNVSTVSIQHHFSRPRRHRFCVNVSNLFCRSTICWNIEALVSIQGLKDVPSSNSNHTTNAVPIQKEVFIKFLVTRGSNVTFLVDFGDNSSRLEVSGNSIYESDYVCTRAWHKYKRCGNYTVTVNAFNAVSKEILILPGRFVAELNITEQAILELKSVTKNVEFKNHTPLDFQISGARPQVEGCHVRYTWNFGDGTGDIKKHGSKAQHHFKVNTTGKYKVMVTVSNNLHSVTLQAVHVYFHEKLKGINLSVSDIKAKCLQKRCLKFKAEVDPASETNLTRYSWNLGNGNHIPAGTNSEQSYNNYKIGRYWVQVTADNGISNVTSRLYVIVQEQIKKLILADIPVTLLEQVTNFNATTQGTNVTFFWEFGDGSNKTEGTGNTSHKYLRTGRYVVSVTATNEMNKMTATKFADVSQVCATFNMFGMEDSQNEVTRSQRIDLEADVIVTCRNITGVLYKWKVHHISGKLKETLNVGVSLNQRFILLPRSLKYGPHEIVLEVEIESKGNWMKLNHNETRKFNVTNSDLVAIIAGGTEKEFSYDADMNTNITLNASDSYDPDLHPIEQSKQKLKFLWSCSIPSNTTASCFKEVWKDKLNMRGDKLTFPVEWLILLPLEDKFRFSLTLMKDGRRNSISEQSLIVGNHKAHELSVTCRLCIHGEVNPIEALVVTGDCRTCVNASGIKYDWTLYRDNRDSKKPSIGCKDRLVKPNTTTTTAKPKTTTTTATTTITPDECSGEASTRRTGFIRRPTGRTPVKETHTVGKIGRGSMCLDDPEFPAVNTSNKRSRPSCHGFGGGKGSGSKPKPTEATGSEGGSKAPKFDGTTAPPVIVPVEWMELNEPKTSTGTRRQNLVILDRFLPGALYKLELKVTCGGRQGSASVIFKTQGKPLEKQRNSGGCSVTPATGTELKTSFKLSCTGWTHANFDVRYGNSGDDTRQCVYSGYRPSASFVLPSLLAKDEYEVNLDIVVRDGRGVTEECRSVYVRPGNASQRIAVGEIMNELDVLEDLGDQQALMQRITAVAITLNSLYTVRNTTISFDRTKTMTDLLKKLQNITVQDEVIAQQLGLAVRTVTYATDELVEQHLKIASGILAALDSVTRKNTSGARLVDELSLWSRSSIDDVADSALQVTSNLLAGVYTLSESVLVPSQLGSWQQFVVQIMRKTERIIKEKLVSRVFGEEPIHKNLPYFSVFADQVMSVSGTTLSLRDVQLHLPSNLERHLGIASDEYVGRLLIVYKMNPHKRYDASLVHHTEVATFKLMRCTARKYEGRCSMQEVAVRNLSQDISISFPATVHKDFNMTGNVSLSWQNMNVHEVNRTQRARHQSLQVTVKLLRPLPRGFVLKLLFRKGIPPTKNQYDLSTHSSQGEVTWLLRPHLQTGSERIHIGLLLEDVYYRITKFIKVPSVHYSFDSRWVGCYYYNEESEDWRDDGCQMKLLTDTTIHCRCNRLAAFSGGVLPVHHTLSVHDLSYIRLDEFPILLALVCAIVFVYLILLVVCVWADSREPRKHGVVFINDNPFASYFQSYQIMVETGNCFNAGTTASVNIILHGEGISSEPIELKAEPGQRLFERTSRDVFVTCVPENLRSIWKVHIWHNNKGKDPSWFLERVVVKELGTQRKWFFEAHRWLAVDEEDGRVDCELQLKHAGFSANIARKVGQNFLDYHLWVSVAGRPSYSRFTRAQRLSCCLSLLLSFLCFNLVGYKPNSEDSPVLGALDVSWTTVLVGVLSSLMALPVNLLWILMFRYSEREVKSSAESETNTIVNSASGKAKRGVFLLEQSAKTLAYLKNLKRVTSSTKDNTKHAYDSFSDTSSYVTRHSIDSDYSSEPSSLGYKSDSAWRPSPVRVCSDDHDLEINNRSVRRSFSLPHGFVYLAWIGSLLTSTAAAFLTVWFGLSFGQDLSLCWLQSFCCAVMESLFISQPALVILLALSVAISPHKRVHPSGAVTEPVDEDVDEECEEMTSDGQDSFTNFGYTTEFKDELEAAVEVRKRKRYLKYLRPPSKDRLSDAREKRLQRKACVEYATEVVVLCVSLLVTCFLVAGFNSPYVSQLNRSLEDSLHRPQVEARTPFDWWNSQSPMLVHTLYWEVGITAYAPLNVTPVTTFIRGSQSLLVGNPKISQYRADTVTACRANETGMAERAHRPRNQSAQQNSTQSGNQSAQQNSTQSGNQSAQQNSTQSGNQSAQQNSTQSGNQSALQNASHTAESLCRYMCAWDRGTWLEMSLKNTRAEAVRQLNMMAASEWVNPCTKELRVELTVFTKALGALSTVALSVQASLAGKPISDVQVNTVQTNENFTINANFLAACKILFILCYFYLVQREFFLLFKMSSKYFQCFWRLLEFFTLVLSSMCIVCYVRWSVRLYLLIKNIRREKLNMVYGVLTQAHWDQEMLRNLYAFVIFMTVIKALHLLRVWRLMAEFGRVLSAASSTLCSCLVVFLLYLMVFVHPGYLLFGRLHASFSSFTDTFHLACNFFRLKGVAHYQGPMFDTYPSQCCVYFALFILGFFVILRGMSAAVVLSYVRQMKWQRRRDFPAHGILDCVCKCVSYLKNYRDRNRYKRHREPWIDDIFPVEYAIGEIENQMEELLIRVGDLIGESVETSTSSLDTYSESDGDVEYLYRGEPGHCGSFVVSGYESDQSALSEGCEGLVPVSSSCSPALTGSAVSTAARGTDSETLLRQPHAEERWGPGEVEWGPGGLLLKDESAERAHSSLVLSLNNSYQLHTERSPMHAKHMYGLTRKFHGSEVFSSTEGFTPSVSSWQSYALPYQHLPSEHPTAACSRAAAHKSANEKHQTHHKVSVLNRNRAISPGVTTVVPQPSSHANHQVNSGTSLTRWTPSSRPHNVMGSFLCAGTGSDQSNSSEGAPRPAWGSLPSASERGMTSDVPRVFPLLTTPLPNVGSDTSRPTRRCEK